MKIKKIEKVLPITVYAVKTSTNTFVSNKLAHHNCYACNCALNGNYVQYTLYMMNERGYSVDQIEEMQNRRNKVVKYTVHDLYFIYEEYKSKSKEILDRLEEI